MVDRGIGWLMNKGVGALISGFGDYRVEGNTLMTGGMDPPTVVNSVGTGSVIVRHREYLQDINPSVNFTLQSLNLNPGLLASFPWLSAIAQHFEQYRFRGLLFEFKSLSSDAVLSTATSSALGSVVMATQYNALSPHFPDKFTMENYEFANSSKPSLSFIHPVECLKKDTTLTELYVRGGAPAAGSDLRLYDLGVFNIATVGMQGTTGVVGELWCTYEIELIKPKISNPIDSQEYVDHFLLNSGSTNATPWALATLDPNSSLGGTLYNNSYVFPSDVTDGVYILQWYVQGGSTVLTGPSHTFTSNCEAFPLFDGNTQHIAGVSTGATGSGYMVWYSMQITGPAAVFTIGSGGVLPTSITYGDVFVMGVPANLDLVSERDDDECPLTLTNPTIATQTQQMLVLLKELGLLKIS